MHDQYTSNHSGSELVLLANGAQNTDRIRIEGYNGLNFYSISIMCGVKFDGEIGNWLIMSYRWWCRNISDIISE